MTTDLTKYAGGNLPASALSNQWEAQAQAAAEAEPQQTGQFLSTKGGILAMGDSPLPGNQVACIILDSMRENALYADKWDETDPKPPICYAFGRDGDSMSPSETMAKHIQAAQAKGEAPYFQPQHFPCQGCWAHEWGSAEQGRGKACQERRRLTIIPAGYYTPRPRSRDLDLQLFTDPAHFQSVDYAFLRLPVTSVANWAKYVQQLSANLRRPPHGVVTLIRVEPDPKTQLKVTFETIELVPDDIGQIVIARNEAMRAIPEKGYEPPDPQAAAQRQQHAMAGLRRPGA